MIAIYKSKKQPLKSIVYGLDGIGKSTFAARAPKPVFLSLENGLSALDVDVLSVKPSVPDILATLRALGSETHQYQTLVIDTLDWLETVVWAQVCKDGGKPNIEAFGYAKGYVFAVDVWKQIIEALPAKMGVIALAHQATRKIELPEGGQFDHVDLKIHPKSAALWREWADCVLYATREMRAIADPQNERRVIGRTDGSRVLKTQWSAGYEAKSRYPLPATIPLDYAAFSEALAVDPEVLASALERATALANSAKEPMRKKALAAIAAAQTDVKRLYEIAEKLESEV